MCNKEKEFEKILKELSKGLNPDYKNVVDEYDEDDSSLEFGNASLNHALYIIAKMFARAKKDICIMSGTLFEGYAETVKELLSLFAPDLQSVRIITLQELDKAKLAGFRKVVQKINDGREKPVVEFLALQNSGKPEDFRHYYVVDGKAWREENPHGFLPKCFDIKAEVCFNDPERGTQLQEKFDTVWNEFSAHATVGA